jgi:hypothetical protein
MKTPIKYFLKSIASLTKEKIDFKYEDETVTFLPPAEILIMPGFFRGFECKRCCVCCQKGISPLVYSDSDVANMMKLGSTYNSVAKLYDAMEMLPCKINNEDKNLWLYQFEGFRCGFDSLCEGDDVWGCDLHFANLKQLLCLMPWVRVGTRGNKAVISKKPFGYSWAFGCRATWRESFDEDQFLKHDMVIVERIIASAKDLGIRTYWPDIQKWLHDWYNDYKTGKVLLPTETVSMLGNGNGEIKGFKSDKFF